MLLTYYALMVFYIGPEWKQQELVSIRTDGDKAKCEQVLRHRVAFQSALGNLKGNSSECRLLPVPK